jgi:hypothetical protein
VNESPTLLSQRDGGLVHTDTLVAMDTATPTWVAMAVAVIALLGVLVAQSITLYNERARRRDEQTKAVRDEVHEVMMAFFAFADFAQATRSVKKRDGACDVYDDEWNRVAGPLAAGAANMAGRGSHRDAALILMDGLGLQATAYRDGESIGDSPRVGYIQMSWAGFEVVAAWLRGERIPRHARHVARAARRMRSRLDAEYLYRERAMDERHRTGVVRLAFRKSRWKLTKAWNRWVVRPVEASWRFLFAP